MQTGCDAMIAGMVLFVDPAPSDQFFIVRDCSQAKQTVVCRDQRKVQDLSGGSQRPICRIALRQRELLGDQYDLVGERHIPQGAVAAVSHPEKLAPNA